jgi:hypothetical protein
MGRFELINGPESLERITPSVAAILVSETTIHVIIITSCENI